MIHRPVLKKEILKFWLNSKFLKNDSPIFLVDATCGEGGHSLTLLEKAKKENWLKRLILICIDLDPEILKQAKNNLKKFRDHVIFKNVNYADLAKILDELNLPAGRKEINGILFDLGASSYHFKKESRGFSFRSNDPLDMRYDQRQKLSAFEVINRFPQNEMKNIIQKLGEERSAGRIANLIVKKRRIKPIKTTSELADIILEAIPKKFWHIHRDKNFSGHHKKIHPATKTFQALRIYVNSELNHVEKGIKEAIKKLQKGGRILVISFHSLEDRIIKRIFKEFAEPKKDEIYGKIIEQPQLYIMTKKPMLASQEELEKNPASRSAKLRVAERR